MGGGVRPEWLATKKITLFAASVINWSFDGVNRIIQLMFLNYTSMLYISYWNMVLLKAYYVIYIYLKEKNPYSHSDTLPSTLQ